MVTGHGSNTIGGCNLFRPHDRAEIKTDLIVRKAL